MSKENVVGKEIEIDSPEYNKKSKTGFVVLLLLGMFAGAICGFFGINIIEAIEKTNFADNMVDIGINVQVYVMPWILTVFSLACIIADEILIKKAKKQIEKWDGEDDDYISVVDTSLNKALIISNVFVIVAQLMYGLATYCMENLFEKLSNPLFAIFTAVVFMAGLIFAVVQQGRIINLVKKYAPEKKGSIYDRKFQKVWYESCDEYERKIIGEASYRTISILNLAFSIVFGITVVLGMFVPIGILCSVFVGILYLILSCSYAIIANQLEKGIKK